MEGGEAFPEVARAELTGTVTDPEGLAAAVDILTRPLPGDFAALYSLRVAKSGGLRMAVATAGDPMALFRPIQERLWEMDRDIVLSDPQETASRQQPLEHGVRHLKKDSVHGERSVGGYDRHGATANRVIVTSNDHVAPDQPVKSQCAGCRDKAVVDCAAEQRHGNWIPRHS